MLSQTNSGVVINESYKPFFFFLKGWESCKVPIHHCELKKMVQWVYIDEEDQKQVDAQPKHKSHIIIKMDSLLQKLAQMTKITRRFYKNLHLKPNYMTILINCHVNLRLHDSFDKPSCNISVLTIPTSPDFILQNSSEPQKILQRRTKPDPPLPFNIVTTVHHTNTLLQSYL